jgi:hypothetical protein
MSCSDRQAAVRWRTSGNVLDVLAFFRRPTEPQAAAFIFSPCPHRRMCDNVRNSTKKTQETHLGRRCNDLGTNRLSMRAWLVSGTAAVVADKCASSAARSPFCSPADV